MRKIYKPETFEKDENGILKISPNTEIDRTGKWVIRADSRIVGYDIVFAGAGDTWNPMGVGTGTEFRFDFSDPNQLEPNPPSGFQKIRVQWQFIDDVFLKEGTLFNYNAPKGSYIDFYFLCPAGYYYERKIYDADVSMPNYVLADEDTICNRGIVKYFIEGSCPMGDELNTEACTDEVVPRYIIWNAEFTVPEVTGWQDFHGHFSFEIYRKASVYFAD